MKYSSRLTGLLYSWRLAQSMIENYKNGSVLYKQNSGSHKHYENAEKLVLELTEKCESIWNEFWQIVEEAGAVHIDVHGLWIPSD